MIADPGERQIGERDVVLVQFVEGDGVGRRLDRALAGQHHAFGRAGGAGGVENDGRIGALAGGDLGIEPGADRRIGERLAAFRDDVVDRMQVAVIVVAQAAPLVVDHLLELGQAIHDRHDLVDLLLVLDRGKAHFGMRQHEGELVGDRVGIDRHRHRAEHLRRHHRPIELRPVGADDGDGLAALEAEPVQADRIGAHDVEHLAQVQVCQMPRSLCRIAGRAPYKLAFRINSLGNVSAGAAAIGRHSLILPLGRAR